jgi:hypothetical protein
VPKKTPNKTCLAYVQNMEQGEKTFIHEDDTKKFKQNFKCINQNHAYHITTIDTAVNTCKMQPSKLQIFHKQQHPYNAKYLKLIT